MACQASAHVARGWINSSDRLHGGQGTREGQKRKSALFLRMFVFYFSTITADGCLALVRALYLQQTQFPLHLEMNGVRRGFFKRGCLVGGWALAGLGPLLFLPCRSGRRRRRRVQHYPGSGALALRNRVASGQAGAPSCLLSLGRLRGGDSRCRLRGLLSRHRF